MLTWTSRSSSSPEGRTVAFPPPPHTGTPSRLQDTRGSGTPWAAQGSSTSSPSRTASSTGPAAMTGGTGGQRLVPTSTATFHWEVPGKELSGGGGKHWSPRSYLTLHNQPGPPCRGARGVASHAQVGARIPWRGSEEMELPVGEHLQPRPCGDGQE